MGIVSVKDSSGAPWEGCVVEIGPTITRTPPSGIVKIPHHSGTLTIKVSGILVYVLSHGNRPDITVTNDVKQGKLQVTLGSS